jgi:hypothetical protein
MFVFVGILALWTLYECYLEYKRHKRLVRTVPRPPDFQNFVGSQPQLEEIKVGPAVVVEPHVRQEFQEELSLSGDKDK